MTTTFFSLFFSHIFHFSYCLPSLCAQYAFHSQAALHGFDPSDAVLEISPRAGEFTLREKDILDVIEREGDTIALVLFSGIQYFTGQWFPMEKITSKAQDKVRKENVISWGYNVLAFLFSLCRNFCNLDISLIRFFLGLHLWLGSCSRSRERASVVA